MGKSKIKVTDGAPPASDPINIPKNTARPFWDEVRRSNSSPAALGSGHSSSSFVPSPFLSPKSPMYSRLFPRGLFHTSPQRFELVDIGATPAVKVKLDDSAANNAL